MRGRKPHSTARRTLDGNPGKRRINEFEPQPPDLARPEVAADEALPPELADLPVAVREWQRLAPMLRRCRQITEADRTPLIAVCIEWSRYVEANEKIRTLGMIVKAPSGYPITNPYLPVANRALAACTKLWAELGLTPSSRTRVTTGDPAGPGGDDFSEFDAVEELPLDDTTH